MNINSRLTIFILRISFLLIVPLSLAAGDTKPSKLFSDTSEMKVTLSGPWNTIHRNVKEDALYPVQLTYTDEDGQQHTLDAEVAPRGKSRRINVCRFPPLKIHFDEERVKGTKFRGNKSLKLVTYCHSHPKYEQYYVKEFLAYRIYNLITEYSFRVRPLVIEYRDSEKSGDSISRFSFLIEDIDKVAKRNDLKKLTLTSIPFKHLDPVESSNFSLFQYMIGHLDWAAYSGPKKDKCCHNSKLIGAGEARHPKYGIPYDFDSSGLVNAHYAKPPQQLKRLRNISQRLYRGFCIFNDTLPQAAELFNDKKTDILALFENAPHLTDKSRHKAVDYIEDFYAVLNDPKRFKKEITDKCRG